ncbi:MAG: hypothetical protein JWO52_2533, partial [Gammaproteobacteria bacterium]|nr:hypothetical protein [Gammaproteobacteria bacterium]
MSEADAKAQGSRPDHNEPCSQGIKLPRHDTDARTCKDARNCKNSRTR